MFYVFAYIDRHKIAAQSQGLGPCAPHLLDDPSAETLQIRFEVVADGPSRRFAWSPGQVYI